MRTTLLRIGNSQGVILPKAILAEVGFERDIDMAVEGGAVVLRNPEGHPRQGWASASREIAAAEDDALAWPEFANTGDDELTW